MFSNCDWIFIDVVSRATAFVLSSNTSLPFHLNFSDVNFLILTSLLNAWDKSWYKKGFLGSHLSTIWINSPSRSDAWRKVFFDY